MKKFYLLIVFSFFTIAYSQQVSQQWVARYNNPDNLNDAATAMALDSSGNVYIAGYSNRGASSDDFIVIKYSSSGIQQWVALYNGPDNNVDQIKCMAVDNAGNIIVTGFNENSAHRRTLCTIKYNSAGVLQWVARYTHSDTNSVSPADIKTDNLGNIYITGDITYGYNSTAFALKYYSNGTINWINFNQYVQGYMHSKSVVPDNSGFVYAAGYAEEFEAGEYFLIKYNSLGDTVWKKAWGWQGSMSMPIMNSMIMDPSGNSYINAYRINQYSPPQYYYETFKYNSSGVQVWKSVYSMSFSNGEVKGIAADRNYNIYVIGTQLTPGGIGGNLIKYSNSGVQQWTIGYSIGFNGSFIPIAVATDSAGNAYVCNNKTLNNDTTGQNIILLKHSPLGPAMWEMDYNYLDFNDAAVKMIVDKYNNIYVTGNSYKNGVPSDIVTIKYSQLIGISPISQAIPDKYELHQNYPNPFNPSTKIKFSIPFSPFEGGKGDVKLVIFNSLGQQVAELINQWLSTGTCEVEWNASDYPSGIYFYKLTSADFTESKKMILIK